MSRLLPDYDVAAALETADKFSHGKGSPFRILADKRMVLGLDHRLELNEETKDCLNIAELPMEEINALLNLRVMIHCAPYREELIAYHE